MKNLIGILAVGLAVVALLLTTCNGPSTESLTTTSSSAPVTQIQPSTPTAEPSPSPSPAAIPTEPASAHEPVPATTPAPTVPTRPRVDAPTASTVSSPAEPTAPSAPAFFALAPLSPELLPDNGLETVLAVHPLDLEGGSGASSMLIVSPDSTTEALRSQLRIALPDRNWIPTDFTRGQPSSTINTPTAYGQRWGQVFGGAAYQDRIRYDDWTDGVVSFGMGLGDPVRYVGLDVTVNILDTYTEFAEDRSLSLKLHRQLPYRTAVAVGHENIWHTDGTDGGSSRYVVASKVIVLRDRPTSSFGSMVLNVGLGNDRFLPEAQFAQGEDGVNVFGSLGVRVLPPVNAIANWTGQDLALGLSIAPVRTWPFVITPAVVDVTGNAGDGARFSMSAGLSYNFR